MFLGRFDHVLDDKGRLAIPARFRPGLAEGLVITRGTDRCLWAYPLSTWNNIVSRIEALPMGDPNGRNMRRVTFAAAEPAELDKQGRIVIPERLRRYAGLTTSVAVVGVNSYIEIWDQEKWDEVESDVEDNNEEIAAQLAALF